jgi:Ca2+-binding EF-hand superfamily protein
MPFAILLLAAAAASSPPTLEHHHGHAFISPMGEPVYGSGSDDALHAWFGRADLNHDGSLTVDEMRVDAERFFTALDMNHDGEIDPDEITRYENVVAPGDRTGLFNLREPVIAADTDFNRGVSLEEFRKAAAIRFQALDVDHQGRLTAALLESLRPAAPAREKHDAPASNDAQTILPQ